jgi:hypothetical protein
MLISHKPFILDWNIKAGNTYKVLITVKDPITKEPIDLTGIRIEGDARISPTTTQLFPIPILIIDQVTYKGQFEINLSSAFTTSLSSVTKPKTFNYDIDLIYPNLERYTFVEGKFDVSKGYTVDGDL